MVRRSSTGIDGQPVQTAIPVRANIDEMRNRLRHLGPSNPATNPKNTRSTTVKIKPGGHPVSVALPPRAASVAGDIIEEVSQREEEQAGETTSLLRPQLSGKDGVKALRQSYGSTSPAAALPQEPQEQLITPAIEIADTEQRDVATQTNVKAAEEDLIDMAAIPSASETGQSLRSDYSAQALRRSFVRSGSITENIIESGGVRKVILQTTSSADEDEGKQSADASPITPGAQSQPLSPLASEPMSDGEEDDQDNGAAGGPSGQPKAPGRKKNTRRKKRKGGRS
jgi:metal transporter CNNM